MLLIVTFVVTDTLLWLLFSASLFSALLCSFSALRDFLGGDEDVPGPGADTDPDPVADEDVPGPGADTDPDPVADEEEAP